MKTLYEVQQLLERFGILVHLGKRKWDIEMMAIELDQLYRSGVLNQKTYQRAKLVLRHEHEYEVQHEKNHQND